MVEMAVLLIYRPHQECRICISTTSPDIANADNGGRGGAVFLDCSNMTVLADDPVPLYFGEEVSFVGGCSAVKGTWIYLHSVAAARLGFRQLKFPKAESLGTYTPAEAQLTVMYTETMTSPELYLYFPLLPFLPRDT